MKEDKETILTKKFIDQYFEELTINVAEHLADHYNNNITNLYESYVDDNESVTDSETDSSVSSHSVTKADLTKLHRDNNFQTPEEVANKLKIFITQIYNDNRELSASSINLVLYLMDNCSKHFSDVYNKMIEHVESFNPIKYANLSLKQYKENPREFLNNHNLAIKQFEDYDAKSKMIKNALKASKEDILSVAIQDAVSSPNVEKIKEEILKLSLAVEEGQGVINLSKKQKSNNNPTISKKTWLDFKSFVHKSIFPQR